MKKHISLLVFLWVALASVGNQAYAFSNLPREFSHKDSQNFRSDQNSKLFLIVENESENIQILQDIEPDPGIQNTEIFQIRESFAGEENLRTFFTTARDNKSLLKIQIFPFHFFW